MTTHQGRTEHDSLGDIEVPAAALWGAITQRAVHNFRISGRPVCPEIVHALATIKAAAATTNARLGVIDPATADAIVAAAEQVASGHHDDQFPVDRLQTGSGTSTNINVNEVIAHAKIKSMLDAGEPMPSYLRDNVVYYAGPAKTPEGYASGSFGPTTAGRMDSYVDQFQKAGGSYVMLAKGNRSAQVTKACHDNGGFYLGSIGGPAARLAQDVIKKVDVLEFPELGMEAVWKIEVEDFPAFIVVDDKGNDFFAETSKPTLTSIPVGPPA